MRISSSSVSQVSEGDTVTLSCTSKCTFHLLEVRWFRNGDALSVSGPTLLLSPLTAEDSGNYTCALTTGAGTSAAFSLEVASKDNQRSAGLFYLKSGATHLIAHHVTYSVTSSRHFVHRARCAASDGRRTLWRPARVAYNSSAALHLQQVLSSPDTLRPNYPGYT